MSALILLATLKTGGLSNTAVLAEFFAGKLQEKGITSETIKLVDHNILPGTYNDMGEGDAWPAILEKIMAAEMVIFATPIWWGNHSSEMQKVIERLDNIHDEILAGKSSRLANKVAGIIITGDSDGAQHIIGNISNFLNAIGVILPPYASLSVLWEGQKKGAKTTRAELMKKYEETYSKTADTMIAQLLKFTGQYAETAHIQ
ncbi:flavodoxin family protein [Chitinophaga agrisoli]|uniref:Flavodoxin family protein n=1 Tax=Chitinophaga agrisoli TaxID=2607653 RepID=A0A5B2VND3_9BACT|nr:NAD(P)H-dependent oxidoreductase [Chitinophaga agrisoli]KAA2240284.1 flavodoxin family protein [Chitinophaga agrisoli]